MTNNKSSGASGGNKPSVVKRGAGVDLAYWVREGGSSNRQNVKVRWFWRNVNGEYIDKSMYLYLRELKELMNIASKFIGEVELLKKNNLHPKSEGGGGGG